MYVWVSIKKALITIDFKDYSSRQVRLSMELGKIRILEQSFHLTLCEAQKFLVLKFFLELYMTLLEMLPFSLSLKSKTSESPLPSFSFISLLDLKQM
jgi:hypothetical protein